MTALRGGLVGCGFFAINQLHGWRDATGADIAAICDRDPERLRIVGDQFGIGRRYTDATAMLEALIRPSKARMSPPCCSATPAT